MASSGTCRTYAVVELKDSASALPPKEWLASASWYATPLTFDVSASELGCRDLIYQCQSDWRAENYARINKALNQPGSVYSVLGRSPAHENIHQASMYLYSKVEGLAAYVRYGD